MSSDFVSIIDDFIQRVCKIELFFFHSLSFFFAGCLCYLAGVDKFPDRMCKNIIA